MRKRLVRAAALVAGWLLLLFPNVPRGVRQIGHLLDPSALIEPDHPEVARFAAEIDRRIGTDRPAGEQVRAVEAAVARGVAYTHDWVQWWNVDYWPTASEVALAGREDCDGLAVLAASILRRRGFDARIEGNLVHVWVAVDLPAEPPQRILGPMETTVFDERGGWAFPPLANLFEGAKFILAEFPLWRWTLLVAFSVIVLAWRAPRLPLRAALALAGLVASVAAARTLTVVPFALILAAALAATAAAVLVRRRAAPTTFSPAA